MAYRAVSFPGSARALACWLRRLAATNFFEKSVETSSIVSRRAGALEKVRAGEAPAPAREARALPRFSANISRGAVDLSVTSMSVFEVEEI
jgi:hypothetical protein